MVELLKKRHITNAIAKSYAKYTKNKPIILIDLGATNCRATIRNEKGEKILRGILKSKYHAKVKPSKKSVLDAIHKVTERYLEVYTEAEVRIAVPGIVSDKITLPNLNIANWDLKRELYKLFGHTNIKIINDVVAAYHGENTKGTVIYVGSGIGASENGENLELGRSFTYPDFKYIGYSKGRNIVENFAGGLALKSQCKKYDVNINGDAHEIGKMLNDRALRDENSKRVLHETGKILGELINSYHSHSKHGDDWEYVIGGSLGKNQYYFDGIKQACKLNVKKSGYEGSEAIYKGLIKIFN